MVMLNAMPWLAKITPLVGIVGLMVACFWLLTQISLMVTLDVPVLLATTRIEPGVPVAKAMFVMLICSVAVNWNVRAPIHAATAMLTATVTAMSMIDATTGLRAFLLLRFIFVFIPPFWDWYVC